MGRLAHAPHPLLGELLLDPQLAGAGHVLPDLLRIDAAHVVMLAARGLLAEGTAARLLEVNDDLSARLEAGAETLHAERGHRGIYMLYEQEYVRRLGPHAGGAAHVARSRNDVNATLVRLRLRSELLLTLQAAAELGASALAVARAHAATPMSAFTHLQPAQPSTLGHYLAGWSAEFLRAAEWLDETYAAVNVSPMGAAAGLGTSFPIDRRQVAELLGFDGVIDNATDAVASRDYAVRVLAALALAGVSLSRLATDLQTWSSAAYGFLDWPDELVSTSSIMPQKRNAYAWENARGRATHALGALVSALAGMKNVPFANSIEAGAESLAGLWPALDSSRVALRLVRLLLDHAQVQEERLAAFLAHSQVTMTAVADLLVQRHGLSFRQAHESVGRFLRGRSGAVATHEAGPGLARAVREVTGREPALDPTALARALAPRACVEAAAYGGGPAPDAVAAQLDALDRRLRRLRVAQTGRHAALERAQARLRAAVEQVRQRAGNGPRPWEDAAAHGRAQ